MQQHTENLWSLFAGLPDQVVLREPYTEQGDEYVVRDPVEVARRYAGSGWLAIDTVPNMPRN